MSKETAGDQRRHDSVYPDRNHQSDGQRRQSANGASPASPDNKPWIENPGRLLAAMALAGAVLAVGLYAGFELRRVRLGTRRNPYRIYEKESLSEADTDYGALGI